MAMRHAPPLWCVAMLVGVAAFAGGLGSVQAAPPPTGTLRVDPSTVRPERNRTPPQHITKPLTVYRTAAPTGGPFAPSAVPSLDGSPVEYLILTSETLRPAFQRLADWKTAKGVPAVVRTLDDVLARGVHGSDVAETLRWYIRDAYQYWGVRFVLLAGDTEILPPRYVAEEFLGLSDPVTDLYYSCLDGEWNADGDGDFGESYVEASNPGDFADLVAEVFVGRIPASTLAEANLSVDKLLEYERPSTTNYQNKFLLLAEVLFPVDWTPETPVSIDGANFAENVRSLIPGSMQTTRLYQNLVPYPGSSPLSVASSVSEIDAGHGIVVHVGHGWRYTLSVGDGSLDVGHAAAFTNGVRAGLMYMLNCTAAAYDFESFAEAMLLDPTGGATHVIGAAREAFPLAAADYQLAFFRHVFDLGERRLGEAMARSREEFVDNAFFNNVDRWTQLTYTLLGDPEAPLRVGTPVALSLAMPPTLAVGSQSVQVTVTDGNGPVANALLCARKANEEYRTARTNAQGQATLVLEPRTPGAVIFTATAVDRLPATATVNATTPSRALVLTGHGLDDDGAGSGTGNGDGRLDAGETASLGLPLRSAGTSSVTGLTATLVSNDAGITVLQSTSTYTNFAAGQERAANTPFVVRLAPSIADGSVVVLTLQLAHANGNETRRVELVVHAARPRIIAVRVDDAVGGDGDGIQEPNETVDLWYTIENLGTGTLQQGALAVTALDAGLQVLDGDALVPALAPGTSGESLGGLRVLQADLGSAHLGRLVLRHLQDATGAARRVDLRRPAPPGAPVFFAAERADEVHLEWATPADTDILGYHIYRASSPGGPFVRANDDLVQPAYFRESGLQSSRRFTYRIVAVDSALVASAPGPVADVSTNPPQVSGWPNDGNDRSSSSVGVGDVDADGILDIVAGVRQIYAWNGRGVELRDADEDPRTWGRFYGDNEAFGSIALADLDPHPGKEIVASTWDAVQRYLVVLRHDGTPLAGWPRALASAPENYRGAAVAPVVVNLDHTGAPEILLAARDGRLYGWHADGTEVANGDADPTTHGVLLATGSPFLRCAPGVADLDPSRPGDEIVLGGTNGNLYAIDAQGQALAGWPRSTFGAGVPFGATFSTGISIADLDRDGTLELVFVDGGARLHALHLDGTSLAGFPKDNVRSASQSVAPSPAIGDLAGDARLEIVISGTDGFLYVFDATGAPLLPGGFIASGPTESSPILGDLDGDPGIEIVLGNEAGVLQAWNMDGTPVNGFPIQLRAEVRGTPTLDDVDDDGDADLALVAWDGVARVWDLGVPWRPDRAPWPTYRGDMHRTGLYGYQVPTPVRVQDFEASAAADGVRLGWSATPEPGDDPDAIRWRIHRAGPFQAPPLGDTEQILYTGTPIGEVRGVGRLEFMDSSVEPGAWYAYVLGMRAGNDAEAFFGPVVVEIAAPVHRLRILGNVPNPFNPLTRVEYEVPAREGGSPVAVELSVFDAQGRLVRTLAHGPHAPGRHVVTWDGRDGFGRSVATGIYLARLSAGGARVTHKLTLLR